jgi:hypothetical protein
MEGRLNNLDLWNSVEVTDPKYTKGFKRGGGFSGTAINFSWLAKRATEKFGPCGIGWGWKIDKEEILEGAAPEDRIHVLRVTLWYVLDGKKGEITHFGQTTFSGQNKNGLFTDEEAPKKSLTDALSKSLSMLGFGADIHMGHYDDNKYLTEVRREFSEDRGAVNENRQTRAAARSSTRDESVKGEVNGENREEVSVSDRIKRAIDRRVVDGEFTDEQRVTAITQLMLHKDTQKALGGMSKDDAQAIKDYAQSKMRELGWLPPNEKRGAEVLEAEFKAAAATTESGNTVDELATKEDLLPSDIADNIKARLDGARTTAELDELWIELDAGATLEQWPDLLNEVLDYYNFQKEELAKPAKPATTRTRRTRS